jgi:hypothetical protein
MFRNHGPRDRKEGQPATLARKLGLGADVEECEIASNKMMCDAGGFVEDVDLAREHVFGFFVGVGGDVARGAGLDAVEARG